jgi:hypothetical protein
VAHAVSELLDEEDDEAQLVGIDRLLDLQWLRLLLLRIVRGVFRHGAR